MPELHIRTALRPVGSGLEYLMTYRSRGTWYVAFALPSGSRQHTRATETFPNEQEAKKFARAKLAETLYVNAGTINPHLPKRTVASAQMLEWLQELDKDDFACVGQRTGMLQAINRHRPKESNRSRKTTHWGKRKLRRDE